ncbi:MAG: hypothetical protein HKM04_04720, partial [Legionellales bacterium]|nr:hypothetical protein [Legionellales bacterium]
MSIIIELDVMLARRKMKLQDLAALGSVDNWFFGCKKSVIGKNWFLFSLNSLLFAS